MRLHRLSLVLLCALVGPIQAETTWSSGAKCVRPLSWYPGVATLGYYNSSVKNVSSYQFEVYCGLHWKGSLNNQLTVTVYYTDNNQTQSLSCAVNYITSSGGQLGNTVYACSTPGGCTSVGGAFTGSGYITMSETVPSNTIAIMARCTLPATGGGGTGYSAIYGLSLYHP